MKTILHDNETGVDLKIEGSFKNAKAKTIDKDGNILMEFEGTYFELLKVIDGLSESGNEITEEEYYYAEHVDEEEETIKSSDLKGTKVKLNESSIWIDDDNNLFVEEDESDGIPYVTSLKSGEGAYISLAHLELSKEKAFVVNFQAGEIVKVKQGKENGGAVGYAKITRLREDGRIVELEGTDVDGRFSNGYVNAIKNLEKIK